MLKYLGIGLDIWDTAFVFEIHHKYVANDFYILNVSSMHGELRKYLMNGFTMLEMTKEFDKRLIYVQNDEYMWKMA